MGKLEFYLWRHFFFLRLSINLKCLVKPLFHICKIHSIIFPLREFFINRSIWSLICLTLADLYIRMVSSHAKLTVMKGLHYNLNWRLAAIWLLSCKILINSEVVKCYWLILISMTSLQASKYDYKIYFVVSRHFISQITVCSVDGQWSLLSWIFKEIGGFIHWASRAVSLGVDFLYFLKRNSVLLGSIAFLTVF